MGHRGQPVRLSDRHTPLMWGRGPRPPGARGHQIATTILPPSLHPRTPRSDGGTTPGRAPVRSRSHGATLVLARKQRGRRAQGRVQQRLHTRLPAATPISLSGSAFGQHAQLRKPCRHLRQLTGYKFRTTQAPQLPPRRPGAARLLRRSHQGARGNPPTSTTGLGPRSAPGAARWETVRAYVRAEACL